MGVVMAHEMTLTRTEKPTTTSPARERIPIGTGGRSRLPLVVYVLALGTFLMLTTEFVVAGILPEVAADLSIGLAESGRLITVFAIGAHRLWAPESKLPSAAFNTTMLVLVAFLVADALFDLQLRVSIDPAFAEPVRLAMLGLLIAGFVALFAGIIRHVIRQEAARVAALED